MSIVSEIFVLFDVCCVGCVLKIECSFVDLSGVELVWGNVIQKCMCVVWDEVV